MATIAKDIVLAVMHLHDCPPPILNCFEAASQTYVKGEAVFLSGGYLTEIASDTPGVIYGIAAGDGSNDASAVANGVIMPTYLADPNTLFEITMLQSSLADHVIAATDIGTPMAIQRDTSANRLYLNASTKAGANVRMFVHKLSRGSAIGDTNARVLASFMPNWVQALGTS